MPAGGLELALGPPQLHRTHARCTQKPRNTKLGVFPMHKRCSGRDLHDPGHGEARGPRKHQPRPRYAREEKRKMRRCASEEIEWCLKTPLLHGNLPKASHAPLPCPTCPNTHWRCSGTSDTARTRRSTLRRPAAMTRREK